jgi:hypothetical protein
MTATEYPRLHQIGCNVKHEPCAHVPWTELDAALDEAGLDRERFDDLFRVQTCDLSGPYPWDVEAVLERMMSGQLTGTQKYWD